MAHGGDHHAATSHGRAASWKHRTPQQRRLQSHSAVTIHPEHAGVHRRGHCVDQVFALLHLQPFYKTPGNCNNKG